MQDAFSTVLSGAKTINRSDIVYLSELATEINTGYGSALLWRTLQEAHLHDYKVVALDGIPHETHAVSYTVAAHLRAAQEKGITPCRVTGLSYDAFAALVRLAEHDKTLGIMQATMGKSP